MKSGASEERNGPLSARECSHRRVEERAESKARVDLRLAVEPSVSVEYTR